MVDEQYVRHHLPFVCDSIFHDGVEVNDIQLCNHWPLCCGGWRRIDMMFPAGGLRSRIVTTIQTTCCYVLMARLWSSIGARRA